MTDRNSKGSQGVTPLQGIAPAAWAWPAAGQMGFLRPTPVQSELVPAVLEGADVVVQAPSGTGRTAGLALAAMRLVETAQGAAGEPQVPSLLIVAFTAEDVQYVAAALEEWGGAGSGVVAAHSGVRADRVAAALRRGAACVVGTPGRVADLAAKGALDPGRLKVVAVLEADLTASLGAMDGVGAIIKAARSASQASPQTVVVSAQQSAELEEFIQQALVHPRYLSFPAVNAGLAALTPYLREVAEDEKFDVVARAMADLAGEHRGALVARTPREADALQAALERGGGGVTVEVIVDGSPELTAALADGRPLVSLHLPLEPAVWAEASLSAATSILVSPAEYWDLARSGLLERHGRPEGTRRRSTRGRKKKEPEGEAGGHVSGDETVVDTDRTPGIAVADRPEPGASEQHAEGPGHRPAVKGTTEAERLQRRYVLRDAARKIERIDPEDATKEAARLVKESLLEAAFQQAFAPAEAEAGEPTIEAVADAEERLRAEQLRRREVDERLREVKRRLTEQEGLAAARAPEEKAATQDRVPVEEEAAAPVPAGLLSDDEVRLVAWARDARERVTELVGRGLRRSEYRILAAYLLESGKADDIIAALLEEVAPLPGPAPRDEGGMVRLFVSIGRIARVTRDQVEGLLIEKAGLRSEDIGRIDVLARYTFLEVKETLAELVIERLSGSELRGREIAVARAKPPKNGYGDTK